MGLTLMDRVHEEREAELPSELRRSLAREELGSEDGIQEASPALAAPAVPS